jgi:transcriptional regulator with XRE-family HTH domain
VPRISPRKYDLPPNRIGELRVASDMRRVDIAAHVGVDTMTLYRWEKGMQPIKDEAKFILAELFGVSVPWLMGWDDDDSSQDGAA